MDRLSNNISVEPKPVDLLHDEPYIIEQTEAATKECTSSILEALKKTYPTVIPQRSLFVSDRPANADQPHAVPFRGNSESDFGPACNLMDICEALGIERPRVSLNSITLYGQTHAANPSHYHGYSRQEKDGKGQLLLISVKDVSPYNPATGSIDRRNTERNKTNTKPREEFSNGKSPFIIVIEKGGMLQCLPLHAGDMLILPSGVFHEFSCKKGFCASLSTLEVADRAEILSQAGWDRSYEDEYKDMLVRTYTKEVGEEPPKNKTITLIDIPSFKEFFEDGEERSDAAVLL